MSAPSFPTEKNDVARIVFEVDPDLENAVGAEDGVEKYEDALRRKAAEEFPNATVEVRHVGVSVKGDRAFDVNGEEFEYSHSEVLAGVTLGAYEEACLGEDTTPRMSM